MNELFKKLLPYAICVLVGAGITSFVWWDFLVRPRDNTIAQLRGDIKSADANAAAARTAMDLALASSKLAAESNRLLADQLGRASGIAGSQQQTISSQQLLLAKQQSILDATESGLNQLAESLSRGGKDIRSIAIAIRDGLEKLFSLYNPGAVRPIESK
jgi:hypothetical protein